MGRIYLFIYSFNYLLVYKFVLRQESIQKKKTLAPLLGKPTTKPFPKKSMSHSLEPNINSNEPPLPPLPKKEN